MRLGLLALVCAATLLGCPKQEDFTPQIAVSPNAANRMNLIPSRAGRPQASANARARAHPMRAGEALGGPNATGKVGDWVLENDEVVFVIDGLGGGGGFAESGGNLIDAADARLRKDELGQLFTYFGTFPRQGVYTAIDAREEKDGTAVVIARGKELYEPAVEVVTEYRLAGADRALLLRTTLRNTGKTAVTGLGLGDAIQWGGAEKIAPGKALGFKGPSKGPYLGGVGRYASYALTSTEGEIEAINGSSWSDTEQKKAVALGPGQSVQYERVFVVGERPDTASIVAELTRASGGDVGAVAVSLVDKTGKPVEAPAGAKIAFGPPGGTNEVLSMVAAKAGALGGEIVPGTWSVAYVPSAGRGGDGTRAEVAVRKNETSKISLVVSDVASLAAGCTEGGKRVPCKIIVEGLEGTTSPDFGPAHVAHAAKNQLFAATEDVTADVAPGKYRLTAARGNEYALATTEITLAPGAAEKKTLPLKRVVDTAGYVATDFHQHTMLSADAPVTARDRVVSNAVEGVEVAVASEHNVVVDFGPIVRELGLGAFHVAIAGNELTSDASREPWGHANVYPLVADPWKPRGGAVAVRDRLAKDVLADVRADGRVVQINHPRSGSNGYFDRLKLDPKTGEGTGPGYDPAFDALEVWNGRNVEGRDKTLVDFFALLRTSHPVTAIGDTDTHGIVGHEAGYPRTYVRTRDDTFDGWDGARTADMVRAIKQTRDVVLTNGPFLRASANGVGIGGLAKPKDGVVEVKVRVSSAPHVVVEKIELRFAGTTKPELITVTPKASASGAMDAEATFRVRASADDAFVVIASGTRPMRPVLSGDDKEIAPWAMTGAIWIDANGDGKSLGR